jgi:aquaporin Z
MTAPLPRRLAAELIGTFWLVLGGCGTAVLAGTDVGVLGIALAFGLTVMTMAYAFGHVSGGHFNPAVTLGQVVARRFPAREAPAYAAAQAVGAVLAAGLLLVVANGRDGFEADGNFLAANGFGTDGSPQGYGVLAALLVELVLTFGFLLVILGATDRRAHPALAGAAIGLALTLIHLVSIPVTNTSVNPARSLGPAVFVGGTWLTQVWFFVLVPLAGGALAGFAYPSLFGDDAGDTSAA